MLPKLVTFDWDGTLADTRGCVVSSVDVVLYEYGMGSWESVKREYRDPNKTFKENFHNFFGDYADKAYARYLELYHQNMNDCVQAFSGSSELLECLTDRSVEFGIISNKEQSLLDTEVEMLFPDVDFSFVWGKGATARNKPSGEPIMMAAAICGVELFRENIWHVGDIHQDVNAALDAGVSPILIGDAVIPNSNIYRFPTLDIFKDFVCRL